MFTVVIVTWDNIDQCKKCVESIRRFSLYDHQIIVWHNGSDGIVRDADNHYCCTNIGLSSAANKASEFAKCNYICLIDDDIEVLKNWDDSLFLVKSFWTSSTRVEPIAPHYNISVSDWEKGRRPIKWYINISNTPLLIPRTFWKKIGGYDVDFPVVGAELGLAKRAYDHGVRDFLQTPNSVVLHKQSQSVMRINAREARRNRDRIFKCKYGISRKKFVKMIGKGEEYKGKRIWEGA